MSDAGRKGMMRIVMATAVAIFSFTAGTSSAVEYFVAPAPAGSDGNGGTAWSDAFATISNAVAQSDATIVTVSNGTYNIPDQIYITNAITVRSFGGGVHGGLVNATNTIVDAIYGGSASSGPRVFSITDAGVVLDGLTITGGTGRGDTTDPAGGSSRWDGNGVFMSAGLVRHCIIKENGLASGYDHTQGGGVYMTGGTVTNCTIQGNKTGAGNSHGAGVYATGGQILNSRVIGNSIRASQGGGGIYATSASVLIRNCLVFDNTSISHGGGVYGGTVESCTIVENSASGGSSQGGGVYNSTVTNSIVLDNQTGLGLAASANYAGSATLTYSCATPAAAGVGNITAASFVDAAATNFQLLASAPVDAGTNLAWMAGAIDLIGNPRTNGVNNRVDMGAYEKVPGALECSFTADETSVVAPADVVFTALVSGSNLNVTSYTWDFGDGQTTNGAGLAVVTNTYSSAGGYTVSLTVTNDASEGASATNSNYIAVWGDTAYVSASSPSPAAPYDSWANAAHTIVTAVDEAPAGVTVVITNDTYTLSQPLVLDKALTLIGFGDGVSGGLANATNTVVNQGGSNMRAVKITDSGVVLDGLTVSGGNGRGDSYQTDGSGINMTGGIVRNCIIKDNGGSPDYSIRVDGVGVWMSGGTVSNCTVRDNVGLLQSIGGGIYATGGQVLDCQVVDNSIIDSSGDGSGIYANGASVLVRNTLVARNSASDQGGGVFLNNGSIDSCTVVSNSAASGAGGVYRNSGGTVSNSIVYFNTVGGSPDDLNSTAGLAYTCASDGNTSNGNITDAPAFTDLAGGDYRLEACPAVNAGTNQPWMVGALDLAGTNRILSGSVDMGAYERPPSTALECLFVADETSVVAPSNVVFTATVTGGNTNITDYVWDFGDGSISNGASLGVVGHTYSAAGLYTVTLSVTNDAAEVASSTNTDYIAVWGDFAYVSASSPSPAEPYHTWANAAHTIDAALSPAPVGATIAITNGTYNITAEILVDKAVTLTSFGNGVYGGLVNATNTVIDGPADLGNSGPRIFSVTDAGAVLDGLTITDGDGRLQSPTGGLGVYMTDGALHNCIVKENGDMDTNTDHADGGGVYMTGGVVSNCTVEANKVRAGSTTGAGIYATGGQILYSRIFDNETQGSGGGGGIFASSASVLIRNCLITGNSTTGSSGGGVRGGTVESCTIVSNTASGSGDGVYDSTVTNSIVVDNGDGNYAGSASFAYSCSVPAPSGDGNIDSVSFVDPANGDYQLSAGPAVNGGTNLSWMTSAYDLAGTNRILAGSVDMGAYERPPSTALECSFLADVTTVIAPSNVVFTATVTGDNTNITTYVWDFGDGAVSNGASLGIVGHTYTAAGLYTVTLTVTNDGPEGAASTNTDYIAAWGDTAYVSTSSPSPAEPYHTWANAAHTIAAAVDGIPAGGTVVITNGTYEPTAQLVVDKAITVTSFGGGVYGGLQNASNTVIDAVYGGSVSSGPRVFHMTSSGAILDGLTITGGTGRGDGTPGDPGNEDGNGIFMSGGLVRNCIVKENGLGSPNGYDHCEGGGIYMSAGTVSNCTIQGNWTGAGTVPGGGIYALAGQILNCRVLDNSIRASGPGGGIYANSAAVLVRNCLVASNTAQASGGGVYGGTIESCTIVDNLAANASPATSSGGGVFNSAVRNSIVLDNQTGSGVAGIANFAGGSTLSYSCAMPEPSGDGNVASAAFVDAAGGDYRLLACPALDAGTNLAWMVAALDLGGDPRLNGPGSRVDMGAFEKVPGALECAFAADVTSVQAPVDVQFTAILSGTNLSITSYSWDFGDGQSASGAGLAVVTNTYSAIGSHTVTLSVSNDGAEFASRSNANYIAVWGDYAYVSTNSPSSTLPYDTWANAAAVLANVITEAPAGVTVVLSNGTYNTADEIVVDKAITITSFGNGGFGGMANASNTVVDGPANLGNNGPRIFSVTDAGAVLDGLTITDGYGRLQGLGVRMTGGVLQNCIIRDNGKLNVNTDHASGGGVYMTDGVVSNCIIQANQIRAGATFGAGVYASGGLITHCRILDNETESQSGGGIYAAHASMVIRNCLLAGNSAFANGGGVYLNGGRVESSTIVTNAAGADGSGTGGGVFRSSGTVSNSIAYFNTGTGGTVHDNLNATGAWLGYTCSSDAGSATNGNITLDPLFVDLASGDYRLSDASPCIKAGHSGAVSWGTDLDGGPRIRQGRVDLGAFEYAPAAGTVLLIR